MPDSTTPSGASDGARIDVHADDALHHWAKKLDVSVEQLREAVQAVGDRAADVEMHLKGSHATTNADQEAAGEALDGPSPR